MNQRSFGTREHRTVTASVIASLTQGYTIELTPKECDQLGSIRPLLGEGATVYITSLPGAGHEQMITAAAQIAAEGLRPVPHLAARSFARMADVESFLSSLVRTAGVEEVLVVAGSLPRAAGAIDSSLDILRSGLLEGHGIQRVGFAGHPEGHPDIDPAALAAAIREKNEFAMSSGLDVYLLTQFCFSSEPYVRWEREIRTAGNHLSVHAGLPGVTSIRTLLKFGLTCGIGPSLRILRTKSRGLANLAGSRTYRPNRIVDGIAEAVAADPASLFGSFHFYPFGGIGATIQWIESLPQDVA